MILLEELRKCGAIKTRKELEEPFILSDGQESRLFIDIKEACLNPKVLEILSNEMFYHMQHGYDVIYSKLTSNTTIALASVAVGAIQIGVALSLKTGLCHIIVRSEKHKTGTQSRVIGDVKDKICILIEDVSTTGSSIVSAAKAIREAGGKCNIAITAIDREEGAYKLCSDNDIVLLPCIRARCLME